MELSTRSGVAGGCSRDELGIEGLKLLAAYRPLILLANRQEVLGLPLRIDLCSVSPLIRVLVSC